jgi:hypothetical protein
MENRSGLVVGAVVMHADGRGERTAALAMLDTIPGQRPKSFGADKAYDTQDFIAAYPERNITPHVASNDARRGGSAIDGRTTRHDGYEISQTIRKRIEEHFGWAKTVGRIRQTVCRGLRRGDQHFKLTMTANNILRIARMPGAVCREQRDGPRCEGIAADRKASQRPIGRELASGRIRVVFEHRVDHHE